VVFVSINYRLGALGFLCLPGISPGNLGLLDQIAALRFVRDNIAAFGGDPDNVTVVGQSAGAASIAIIMTMPQAGGLFRRAIMQSTPFGRISRTLEDAQRIGRCFAEILELQPEQGGALKSLPFARLLAAQAELGRLERKFADARAPFWAHYRRDGLCRRGYVRTEGRSGLRHRHHDRYHPRGDGSVLLRRRGGCQSQCEGSRRRVCLDVQVGPSGALRRDPQDARVQQQCRFARRPDDRRDVSDR
jgi:hypothetical protein